MSSHGYWKSLCEFSGITGGILTKESALLGGYSGVAMRLLKQEAYLKNRLTKVNVNFDTRRCLEEDNEGKLTYTLVEPVNNGYCIKLSKEISSSLTLLRIEATTVRVCGYVDNIFPHGFFCILWSTSTLNSVLLHGNNAMWVELWFPDLAAPPVINYWDSTLVPRVYNHFSRCKQCLLVVTVSKKLNRNKLWEFNFVELRRDKITVRNCKVTKWFVPDPMLEDHPLFGVNKIHIYPFSGSVCGCPCQDHKMLVQFGSAVVQFNVRKVTSCKYEISDPVNILCPYDDVSFYADEKPMGKFALSQDEKIVALVVRVDEIIEARFQSHIWNLDHMSCGRIVTQFSVDYCLVAAEYVAVGHLYHVVMLKKPEYTEVCIQRVGGNGELTEVVSVDTFPPEMERNECASAHSCGDERWLSSLSGSTSLGMFYISKVLFPHGIQTMISDIRLLRYAV